MSDMKDLYNGLDKLYATKIRLTKEMEEAEAKAWDALSRYKFVMFGYWVGVWVHLNRISGEKRPNPWKELVDMARSKV